MKYKYKILTYGQKFIIQHKRFLFWVPLYTTNRSEPLLFNSAEEADNYIKKVAPKKFVTSLGYTVTNTKKREFSKFDFINSK